MLERHPRDPDDPTRRDPDPREAEGALSRVTAHAVPPIGTTIEHRELRGPLHAHWGDAMREPRIRRLLRGVDPAALRARLRLPTADDRAAWEGFDRGTIAAIEAEAQEEHGSAWPELRASVFARFVRDGDRRQYEAALDDRRQRLTRAVVTAAAKEPDGADAGRWLDEAADGALLLCEQSTWSLPAHDDAHARRGFVVPDAAAPFLDLIAGEIAAQLAVADHVLGGRWDVAWPGLRERIRHEVELRVLTPFETRDDLWWLGYWRDVNNWNPWILGNVLLAAVLLVDDPERIARIASRALESLDRYAATLPADGAIDEGVAYWWNGAARMLECLDLVERLTDGALDATGIPVVGEVLRFPLRMQLGDDWYVNVADGPARTRGRQPWHVPFRWGRRLGDDDVVAWASGGRRGGRPVADVENGLPRLLHGLADAAWRHAEPGRAPLPARVWLPSVQVLVCRATAGDERGLALAAKGGTNDENHNHKDLGSFIVAARGRPLLVDVGKPTYTAETFGDRRYAIRAMQSGWHSTAAPHGFEQGAGPAFLTRVDETPDDGTRLPVTLRLDLAPAYPLGGSERWTRTLRLVSATRIEVADAWRLDDAPTGPGAIHLIAAGTVTVEGTDVVVTADGRRIRITTDERVPPRTELWELDDPELIEVWGAHLTRLTYPIGTSAGTLTTIIEEVGA